MCSTIITLNESHNTRLTHLLILLRLLSAVCECTCCRSSVSFEKREKERERTVKKRSNSRNECIRLQAEIKDARAFFRCEKPNVISFLRLVSCFLVFGTSKPLVVALIVNRSLLVHFTTFIDSV